MLPTGSTSRHILTAAATLTSLLLLASLTNCQSGKSQLPDCPSNESICNAVLHFPDRIVDQGRYCNGCANCALPTSDSDAAAALSAMSDSSFYWQHWEDPNMRVQFIKCSPMPKRPQCGIGNLKPAAIFVSPMSKWSPRLQQLRCSCPDGQFQLRSWRAAEGGQNWQYDFACHLPVCSTTADGRHSGDGEDSPTVDDVDSYDSNVCVVKRRAGENSPISVEFKCACPPEHHCVIKEVETKKPVSENHQGHGGAGGGSGSSGGSGGIGGAGSGGGSGGGGGQEDEWHADPARGGQVSRRRCQKTHHHQNGTNISGGGGTTR